MKLTDPTPIFKVQDDGTETVDYKPPTARDYQAQRYLEQLVATVQGMERVLKTTASEVAKLEELVELYQVTAEKHQDRIKALEDTVVILEEENDLGKEAYYQMRETLKEYRDLVATL